MKYPILNGKLECELREYVLFDGSYASFRAEGGSVGNDDFVRESKPKMKHLSDGEWRAEARSFSGGKKAFSDKRRKDERREFKSDRREDARRTDGRPSPRPGKPGAGRTFKSDKPRRNEMPKREQQPVSLKHKAPSLGADHEVRFDDARKAPVMRSRKGWKKQED